MERSRFVFGAAFPKTVRVAATAADLQRIFELRYEVYVSEYGRMVDKADHANRQLRDPHDDTAIHLMAEVDGELAGCARLHLGGIPSQLAAPLDLWRFHGWSPGDLGFISKFMVRRTHRGSTVAARLMRAFFVLASERRAQAVFCTTFPDLIPLYERGGMSAYGSQYHDTDLGPHRAMVVLMPAVGEPASPSRLERVERGVGSVAPGAI